MQFGMSEVGFPFDDLDRSFACLAEAGYDGVEIRITEDHLESPAEVGEIVDQAADHDLVIPTVMASAAGGSALADPDEATRAAAIEKAKRTFEDVTPLLPDLESILLIPGGVSADLQYDAAFDNAVTAVREIGRAARGADYSISLEYVWNDFLLSPREFAAFVDTVSDAGPIGAYFDVGNVMHRGHPHHWIRILDERIDAVHVKDFDEDIGGFGGFTYPTQADVPWEEVDKALEEIGYDGWITVEVSPYPTHPGHMPGHVLDNLEATFG